MRLTPSLISMTSSVGTRIWPNFASSPARLMRSSRAFFTLFSYCEYACTTYHCIVAVAAGAVVSLIVSASASDTLDSPQQRRIQAPEQQRGDQHDNRDHQRGLQA